MDIPIITIYDSPRLKVRAYYASDTLPDAISVTSVNNAINLTTPSDSPQFIFLNYDDPNTHHTIISDNPLRGRGEGGYCSRIHDGIICYKKVGSIYPSDLPTRSFITAVDLQEGVHR